VRAKHTAKKKRSFKIKKFKDVDKSAVEELEKHGIKTVHDMIKTAKTKALRTQLTRKTGIPITTILEIAKLSNLAQIRAVRSIRARLYHDAGIDSIEKMARPSSDELREITSKFIEKTGFEGIPPTPAEAIFTVKEAKKLKDEIEF
jgi:hypothetical protein